MKDKKGAGAEMTNMQTLINKLPKAIKENLEIGKTILIKKTRHAIVKTIPIIGNAILLV